MNFKKGFTLTEILLSVACLAIIAGISIPIYQSFQTRNDLAIATNTVVQSLRRAQLLSQSSENDTTSGVKLQANSITLFRGTNYAARDINLDEIFEVPNSISFSGINEVIFSKTFGLPTPIGDIVLNSNINETKTITINSKAAISY